MIYNLTLQLVLKYRLRYMITPVQTLNYQESDGKSCMTPAKILVVEDESIVALDITNQLRHLGYTVVGTIDRGEAVLDMVTLSQPDMILLDIRLKGKMDGIEAARRIKDQFDLPIIFLTAYTDQATQARAEMAAPFGFLIKPFKATELREIIESCLAENNLRPEDQNCNSGGL